MNIAAPPKKMRLFSLIMINVIAIDSLRTLSMSAEYGFSSMFYYLIIALVFFVPTALVSAELATTFPERGGIYIWLREAFGKNIGFVVIWLQWFYNICWYPTVMSLVAATIAYCINPELVNNKLYMVSMIMAVYWASTALNCLDMRASNALSNVAAMVGTLFPMLFIALLGLVWWLSGKPLSNPVGVASLLPKWHSIGDLVLLTAMVYGFVGMELSAAHANEVTNPQRHYPIAILGSTVLISIGLTLSTLAIVVAVPVGDMNIISGLLQAFDVYFTEFHLHWLMPVVAVAIALGSTGCAAAWMLGPSKGLLVAGHDGSLPRFLSTVSKRHVPVRILLLQGVIFTFLCLAFVLLPSVSSAFWVLSDVTAILSLVVYVGMFSAALWLRYKYPNIKRAFKVPGGTVGIWLVCLLGLTTSIGTIILGFFPPSQVEVGSLQRYELILGIGVAVSVLVPFVIGALSRRVMRRREEACRATVVAPLQSACEAEALSCE